MPNTASPRTPSRAPRPLVCPDAPEQPSAHRNGTRSVFTCQSGNSTTSFEERLRAVPESSQSPSTGANAPPLLGAPFSGHKSDSKLASISVPSTSEDPWMPAGFAEHAQRIANSAYLSAASRTDPFPCLCPFKHKNGLHTCPMVAESGNELLSHAFLQHKTDGVWVHLWAQAVCGLSSVERKRLIGWIHARPSAAPVWLPSP